MSMGFMCLILSAWYNLFIVCWISFLQKVQHELLSQYETQLLEKEHSGCHTLLRDDKVKLLHLYIDLETNQKIKGMYILHPTVFATEPLHGNYWVSLNKARSCSHFMMPSSQLRNWSWCSKRTWESENLLFTSIKALAMQTLRMEVIVDH